MKKSDPIEPKFSLNASSINKILNSIPKTTRCFQTSNDGGYDGDLIGTVGYFLSQLPKALHENGSAMWNVGDRTVLLVEAVFISAHEVTPRADDDEVCVLLVYWETNQNFKFPVLGTRNASERLGAIDLSTNRRDR